MVQVRSPLLASGGFFHAHHNGGIARYLSGHRAGHLDPGMGLLRPGLPGHDAHAARKVDGLEGVLVDQAQMIIGSLEPEVDHRRIEAKVAGPGALLVAKLFKINERKGTPRSSDKDALDILRILQGIETDALASCLRRILDDERSRDAGERALGLLSELFATRGSEGAAMVARATTPLMDDAEVRLQSELLAQGLIAVLSGEQIPPFCRASCRSRHFEDQPLPEPDFEQRAGQFVVTVRRDWLTDAVMARLDLSEREKKAVYHVKEEGRISNTGYQSLIGVAKGTVYRDLADLVERGVLGRVGKTGKGTFYESAKGPQRGQRGQRFVDIHGGIPKNSPGQPTTLSSPRAKERRTRRRLRMVST